MVSGPTLTRRFARGRAHLPAQRHAHARQQFGHAERLDHVIVGAEFEQMHLLRFGGAHREHDDRHARPGAYALDYLGAVHVGQAEVDDDEIDRPQRSGADRLGAGAGLVHHEAVELETRAQKATDLNLVVDDEHDRGWLTHLRRFRVG